MGWKKARLPIARTVLSATSSGITKKKKSKTKKTADLINAYHTIEKQIAAETDKAVIEELKEKQCALGGVDLYQNASLQGASSQRGGDAGKWLVSALKELDLYKMVLLSDNS